MSCWNNIRNAGKIESNDAKSPGGFWSKYEQLELFGAAAQLSVKLGLHNSPVSHGACGPTWWSTFRTGAGTVSVSIRGPFCGSPDSFAEPYELPDEPSLWPLRSASIASAKPGSAHR